METFKDTLSHAAVTKAVRCSLCRAVLPQVSFCGAGRAVGVFEQAISVDNCQHITHQESKHLLWYS